MENKLVLGIFIFLFGIGFVCAGINSTNYNIDAAVVSSGGTQTNSSNFLSKTALGILSGVISSLNFNNFVGLFYGIDTTSSNVQITYPVRDNLYYSLIGNLNYTVDATALYCWYSKDNGITNSTALVAGTNWTNIYSKTVIGKNNWAVYCNDSANNIGKDTVSFNVDNVTPNVYFSGSTPASNSTLQNSYFTINATSSDAAGEHSAFLDFNNSLVGWWKLEETTDGITFIDSSKYGNNGTCSGASCPSVTGGKRGLAYEFGGNDYINLGNSSVINPTTSETISLWVNLNQIPSGQVSEYPQLIGKRDVDTQRAYFLSFQKGVNKLYWEIKDNAGTYYTLNSIKNTWNAKQWYHITVTFDGTKPSSNTKIYVDGVLDNTGTWNLNYVPQTIATARLGGGNYWLNGSLDDVMIFNRALSDSEIKSIYNAQSNQYGNNFQDIGNGFYNYTIYSQDLAGNTNSSTRNLTIDMSPSSLNVSVINDKVLNSGKGALNLTWVDSSSGEDGFSIERSPDNSTFNEINTTSENTEIYLDDNLLDNSIYFYKIRSFIGGTYSGYSNTAYNITADRTKPINPLLIPIANSSTNKIDVKIDAQDNGLVLYMPFEEGNGTIAYDWSGNEYHGIMNGNPTWTSGKEGNGGALSFDGTDDYINITLSTALSVYTLSGWFYRTDVSGSWGTILGSRPPSSGFEFESIWSGTSRLVMYSGGASAYYTLNNWHHFSLVQNSTRQTLYLDGVLVNTSSVLRTIPIYSQIGAWNQRQWFKGKLDELRVYNRSLTQKEIINDMQSGLIKHKLYRSETQTGQYLDVNLPIINGDAELGTLTNFGFDGVTTDSYQGNYAFYEIGNKWLYTTDLIPVDNTSEYILSGMFKSNGTGGQSRLYFGFVGYDQNKQSIGAANVNTVGGTHTELYEDIKSTDKIVKIKNCTNWYVLNHGRIAFNVDDSGNYADLPNRDLGNGNITRVQNMGDYCEIEFGTTVGKTYSAGTKIRMHTSGGDIYTASSGSLIPFSWTQKSGTIKGEALYSTNNNKFWHGTKFVKFSMGVNYAQDSTYTTIIDNLKLTVNGENISKSNYLEFTSSDIKSPSNVSSLSSPNVSVGGFYTFNSAIFNWTASTDTGDDYFYYVRTQDKEGNEDNLVYNGDFSNYTATNPMSSKWSGWTANAGQWEVGANNKPRIYYGAGGSDTYMLSTTNIMELNKPYRVILNLTINAGMLAWQNTAPNFTATGVYEFTYTPTTEGLRKILLDDFASSSAKDITINSVKIYEIKNQSITTGVAGYSVICDDWERSLPNNIINTTQTNFTCSLNEGVNYFHIKALDGAGNAGNVTRLGPFYIDSGSPQIRFVSPTPTNETQTPNSYTNIKVEVIDYSLRDLNFTLDNTNFSSLGNGLVLAMNFQNLTSLEENNTFVRDISGTGNNGVVVGAVYNESGKHNKGMSFDGNDYIRVYDNPTLDLSDNFTVSAWVKLKSVGSYGIIHKGDSTLKGAGLAYGFEENGFMFISWNGANSPYATRVASDINQWHHLVGVVRNNVRYLYVDGILIGGSALSTSSWNNNKDLIIGASGSIANYLNGHMDEVRVYNRSLTDAEIKLLYESNLQKLSESDWSLSMNITNLSRGEHWYSSKACDMANNCNSTETRVWSRVNILPVVDSVVLNTTNGRIRTSENMSVVIQSHDSDPEDTVYNITDWRVNNNSIAVLNMPFEGGSTSSWTKDYSKNGNNGTVYGATWTTNGKVGGAYNFDGTDDYINIPYGAGKNPSTQPITFSMWVKSDNPSVAKMFMSLGQSPDANARMYLSHYNGYWDMGIQNSGWGSSPVTSATTNWTHITLVMNGTMAKLYVNGTFSMQKSYTSYTFNQNFQIGIHSGGGSYPWDGLIDEVLIFNRSLSEEQIKMIYTAGLNNHSMQNLSSYETVDLENWSVVVTPNDLVEDGMSLESNIISLKNNLPTVVLNSPSNNSDITNRTPEFNWTGTDLDGDTLTYELQIEEHKSAGTAICNDDISRNNLNNNEWTPTQDLKCLGDYGYYYTWRVRAHDGETYGPWTNYNTFRLNAYVVVSLTNSEINFGSIEYLGSKNTSTGNPQPFVIQNDGNVKINISTNATPIWTSQQTESKYYKTKIDNRTGEEGAFKWLTSLFNWVNMSITGRVTIIDSLDFHDNNDSAEIDIHLEVPPNEGPGLKSSTVVFEAKFAETEA